MQIALPERPDGAISTRRHDDDPQTVEECEEYADEQIAAADALEAEWTATGDDIQLWLGENGGCSKPEVGQTPDGAVVSTPGPNCVQKGWDALVKVSEVILNAKAIKTLTSASLSTLRALTTGYIQSFMAGEITAEVMAEMVAGAIADFIGTLNLGWFAAGVVIAAAGVFVYNFVDCYISEAQPQPLGREFGDYEAIAW